MFLPPNMTEAEVLAAIDRTVALLARSFAFGYYDAADIEQEGRLEALKALPRYDCKRPLDNFLYTHVKNRLINLRRDKLRRNDPPCRTCHVSPPGRTQHPDGHYCEPYLDWKRRNDAKANLVRPLDLEHVGEHHAAGDSVVEDHVEMKELLGRIDKELPVELRSTYLQMRAGQPVPKNRRQEVEDSVKRILQDALEGVDD